jgi:2-methylisocitrate lyase-like PEP mutase family enzyme
MTDGAEPGTALMPQRVWSLQSLTAVEAASQTMLAIALSSCGVAGVVLEDQCFPKRCPLLPGQVEIVSIKQAVDRLAAALCARRNPDFLVVARTDAKGAEAVRRCQQFAKLGVDVVHVSSGCFDSLQALRISSAN